MYINEIYLVTGFRTWSRRRIVYTQEVIVMTTPKADAQAASEEHGFDAIPIFQIESIKEIEKGADKAKSNRNCKPSKVCEGADGGDAGESRSRNESSAAESVDENRPFGYSVMIEFANSIEVRTSEDGLNSGRSFYLKVSLTALAA